MTGLVLNVAGGGTLLAIGSQFGVFFGNVLYRLWSGEDV